MTTLEKLVAACRNLVMVKQWSPTPLNRCYEAAQLGIALADYERELATPAHDPPFGIALPPMETAVEQIPPAPAVDRDTLGRAAETA